MARGVTGPPGPSLKSFLRSRSLPNDLPPSANGAQCRQPSRSIPQVLPLLPLAPRRPAALHKWRAALPALPHAARGIDSRLRWSVSLPGLPLVSRDPPPSANGAPHRWPSRSIP
ncbi:hypothetical protein K488DRAFT_92761 [Vararia minispora EC-137]|uniref:Uncharacterized protein n=1 Tax=Vararia minispora EC-137 TaxID=1314806 RepID=A0ACB8Q3S5_9AGAM|nr:hypothetical protein K488DRAFT_92761 [Vararia minispora EC-137]